jgi:hypothetical protein
MAAVFSEAAVAGACCSALPLMLAWLPFLLLFRGPCLHDFKAKIFIEEKVTKTQQSSLGEIYCSLFLA